MGRAFWPPSTGSPQLPAFCYNPYFEVEARKYRFRNDGGEREITRNSRKGPTPGFLSIRMQASLGLTGPRLEGRWSRTPCLIELKRSNDARNPGALVSRGPSTRLLALAICLLTPCAHAQGKKAPAEEPQASPRAAETARVEIEPAKSVRDLDLRWVAIPAGKFQMGCSSGDGDCRGDEKPPHAVRIRKSFRMMAMEVTAGQFRTWALSQEHEPPAQPPWSAPDLPVVGVTWTDAQAFCSAVGGRLPTEAEWEYAARGRSEGARYGSIDSVAWYSDNSERAHPVGAKQPNAYGLFDMLGNVMEWCGDWYGSGYYKQKVDTDPTGPSTGEYRVLRGGSWYDNRLGVRVSTREFYAPTVTGTGYGFRCVRTSG